MTAFTAANFLIYIMHLAYHDLTNAKLNLLLYFAQGYFLQRYRRLLFSDAIEAWSDGPVVPAVYAQYSEYRDWPVTAYDLSLAEIPADAEDLLFDIARTYGQYTETALRYKATVIGSPWDQVYRSQNPHRVIPVDLIEQHFLDLAPLQPAERVFKETDFVGHWDSDGVLVLPKAWDDSEAEE